MLVNKVNIDVGPIYLCIPDSADFFIIIWLKSMHLHQFETVLQHPHFFKTVTSGQYSIFSLECIRNLSKVFFCCTSSLDVVKKKTQKNS